MLHPQGALVGREMTERRNADRVYQQWRKDFWKRKLMETDNEYPGLADSIFSGADSNRECQRATGKSDNQNIARRKIEKLNIFSVVQ